MAPPALRFLAFTTGTNRAPLNGLRDVRLVVPCRTMMIFGIPWFQRVVYLRKLRACMKFKSYFHFSGIRASAFREQGIGDAVWRSRAAFSVQALGMRLQRGAVPAGP